MAAIDSVSANFTPPATHKKTDALSPAESAQVASRMQVHLEAALKSAGVDESKIPGLMSQIGAAVDKANAQGGSPDAMQQAISDVLAKNGVDVHKFEAAMKSPHTKQGPHEGPDAQSTPQTVTPEEAWLAANLEVSMTGRGGIVDLDA